VAWKSLGRPPLALGRGTGRSRSCLPFPHLWAGPASQWPRLPLCVVADGWGPHVISIFILPCLSRTSNRRRTQQPSRDFRDLLPVYGILGLQIGRGDPLFSVFHLKLELHHVRLSVGGRNPRFSRPVRRWSLWEGSSSFS
jgi:hypothetical protein